MKTKLLQKLSMGNVPHEYTTGSSQNKSHSCGSPREAMTHRIQGHTTVIFKRSPLVYAHIILFFKDVTTAESAC